jgi:hypothetical protein
METMDASSGKGKNLIPDLNMEERDDSAGGSKDKPHSEAEVEVAAADADADKGKSVAVADDGEPQADERSVQVTPRPDAPRPSEGNIKALT